METTKNTIKKMQTTRRGKEVLLLGKGKDGKNLYLVKASWDCGWYWGFGYVQSYNRGGIEWHTHIDSSFMGVQKVWDIDKNKFVETDYIHNIYDAPILAETTFSKEEGWQLSELFKQFYKFKEVAEILHIGGAGITTLCDYLKIDYPEKEARCKEINEVILPQIFEKIYSILTPKKD